MADYFLPAGVNPPICHFQNLICGQSFPLQDGLINGWFLGGGWCWETGCGIL
jgi:hypothetical protein